MTQTKRDYYCLQYEPFFGDETDVHLLRDQFVVTRKPHRCNICWEEIPSGHRVRARTEVNREEQKTMTFYFCVPCCEAMAISNFDYGRAIEKRTSLGMAAARKAYAAEAAGGVA